MNRVHRAALWFGFASTALLCGAARAEGTDSPAAVVKTFYETISSNKEPDKLLGLFLSPDTVVTGISGGAGRDRIYTKTAREFVESVKREKQTPCVVDSLTVTMLGETMASVPVQFHNDCVKGKAVFTLTREGGDWRIVSYAWETRLPHEEPAARVGQIIPVGDGPTRLKVIFRQIVLEPGETLSFPALESQNNPSEPDDPYREILAEVKQAPTGSFMPGVGVNSDAGLSGSIVINERNFDLSSLPITLDDVITGMAFWPR